MGQLTLERANELFILTRDGLLLCRHSRPRARAGSEAGSYKGDGYKRVKVDYREYLAHKVVWLMTHGAWPKSEIDHINGIRDDNRPCNLREATSAENNQNKGRQRNNSSGLTGVDLFNNRWRARIRVNKELMHLGYFDTPAEAAAAYAEAKKRLHTFQPVSRVA
jgi:hypothetical protein